MSALIYVLQTLGTLYLVVVLMRFILQLVRADFYNPISQFVVKATQPLLRPLRRIIPGFGGVDWSSLVLAIVLQMLLYAAIMSAGGAPLSSLWGMLLVWAILGITSLFVNIFFFALIISVILSWVAQGSRNPAVELVMQVTEPLLAPFRKFLPNLGGLDISPIFAFIALNLINNFLIADLMQRTGMPPFL